MIFLASPKSLDSAIVDCGKAMLWNSYEDDVSVARAGHFLPALLVQLLFSLSCCGSSWSPHRERPEESQDRYLRLR